MRPPALQRGFSLIELAVVLIVVAFVLGGMLLPLTTQVDARKVRETQEQLEVIQQALIGFAQVNGRLPCPATHTTAGEEMNRGTTGVERGCLDTGGGLRAHGFVPGVTLGLSGGSDDTGQLTDAWGNPLRYSISRALQDIDGDDTNEEWYFVFPEGMRIVGLEQLTPDLFVCNAEAPKPPDGASGLDTTANCGASGTPLTTEAPAVFYSTGPDGAEMAGYASHSLYQLENTGEIPPPPASDPLTLGGFWIAGDRVFVAGTRRGEPGAGDYFDDLVEWLSPVVLYERMIAAGRLP